MLTSDKKNEVNSPCAEFTTRSEATDQIQHKVKIKVRFKWENVRR